MKYLLLAVSLCLSGLAEVAVAEGKKTTVWEGTIHLGDSPESYPRITSAGLAFEVPFRAEPLTPTKLLITVKDIETQAGNGHYVELIAHFERQPSKAPAKNIVVATFRIKDKTLGEKEHPFEFDSGKNLGGMKPDYYSVRIKIDTHVGFTFWDDFLVKRIEVEQ